MEAVIQGEWVGALAGLSLTVSLVSSMRIRTCMERAHVMTIGLGLIAREMTQIKTIEMSAVRAAQGLQTSNALNVSTTPNTTT
jgi:hypothetical protein